MELHELKEKAAAAFAKGKFTKAAELYSEYCQKDPRDLQARVRMGDAWARGGKTEKAIGAYQLAAEGFAKEGFLPRAIAASKLILELDPSHKAVQQMLADLYAQRNIPLPESHSGLAAAPGAARHAVEPSVDRGARAPASAQSAGAEPAPAEPAEEESFQIQRTAADTLHSSSGDPGMEVEEVAVAGLDISREVPPEMLSTGHLFKGGSERRREETRALTAVPPAARASAGEAAAPKTSAEPSTAQGKRAPPTPAAEPAKPPLQPSAPGRPTSETQTPVATKMPPQPPAAEHVLLSAEEIVDPPNRIAHRSASPQPAPPEQRSVPQQRTAPAQPARPQAPGPTTVPSPPVPTPPEDIAQPQSADAQAGALPDFDGLDMEVDTSSPSGEPFTELELEGDSLLHAVERAAQLGLAQRARAPQSEPIAATATRVETPAEAAPLRKLPKVPLFSDLSPDAFIELFERGPMRRFKKGERIFEQGSVGDSFYVICGGKVRVVRDEDGALKEIAALDEGSFFGEMAILSGSPRTASVESASEETELLEISANLLSQLSERYPPVAQALKKFCRQRLLANVMSTSALFQPFDSKERRALIERFRAREVTKGAAIVREGERSGGLFVVLSGEVSVSKADRPLALLREGEIFGEMSLLTKTPATATVTATRRTSLLRLPREDFEELIMSHPQILVLVSELSDDRRRLTEAVIQGSARVGERGLILV